MNARSFARIDKATFYRFIAGRRDGRYEFDRGYIVQQMTGGTLQHGLVTSRLKRLIEAQMDAKRLHVLQDRSVETRVTIRFPDIVAERAGAARGSLSTVEPVLIVEVLSPSTTATDLEVKPSEYLLLPSLAVYIVSRQDEAACLAWVRRSEGHFPDEPVEFGAGGMIAVPALGLRINIDDIYAGIDLSTQDQTPHG